MMMEGLDHHCMPEISFLSKNSKLKHTQGQTLKMELGGAKWKLLEETFNILGGEIKNHKNFSGKK